jgi:light-regulated signal transduction histidine kinase (bacteriophytochrome)
VQVAVTAQTQPGNRLALRFTVRDTGIGIPEATGCAFQRFRPGRCVDHAPVRRQRPGAGDQPRLARMMDGDITVDSTPGVGSTFCLTACLDQAKVTDSTSPVVDAEGSGVAVDAAHPSCRPAHPARRG